MLPLIIFCGNENPDVELDSEVVARVGEEMAREMEAEGEERTLGRRVEEGGAERTLGRRVEEGREERTLGRRVEEGGEVTAKEGSENGFFSNPTPSSSTQTLSEKSKS